MNIIMKSIHCHYQYDIWLKWFEWNYWPVRSFSAIFNVYNISHIVFKFPCKFINCIICCPSYEDESYFREFDKLLIVRKRWFIGTFSTVLLGHIYVVQIIFEKHIIKIVVCLWQELSLVLTQWLIKKNGGMNELKVGSCYHCNFLNLKKT